MDEKSAVNLYSCEGHTTERISLLSVCPTNQEGERTMSFIGAPLKDAKEKEPVPEGEYDLIIEAAELIEKDGKQRVSIRHSIQGEKDAPAVFHNIFLTLSDDEDKANTQLLFMKAYLELFEIPYKGTGFELDELPGSTATCNIGQREWEGKVFNEIKLSI
jgi:hypothetical protein